MVASLGIGNPKVHMDAKIARDMHHSIMNQTRAKTDNWSVYSDDSVQFSEEPRVKVTT